MASTTVQPRHRSTISQIPEHLRPFHRPLYTSLPADLTHKSSRTVSFADSLSSSARQFPSALSHTPSARSVSFPASHPLPARKVSFATSESSSARSASTDELYLRDRRQVPKRSRREILKDVLLKDWLGANRCVPDPKPGSHKTYPRPRSHSQSRGKGGAMPITRMKDSDDYLTARAANPRTGMISPSVGTRTPGVSSTPSSPGEALQRASVDFGYDVAAAAEQRFRPPLVRRANEGRKVSTGVLRRKPVGAEADGGGKDGEVVGLGMGDKVLLSWPGLEDAPVNAGIAIIPGAFPSASPPCPNPAAAALSADALVVRMPSAQEPQPYAYPGCNSQQIEALRLHGQSWRRKDSAVDIASDDPVGDRAYAAATAAAVLCPAVEEVYVPKRRKPIQLHIAEMHAATRSPDKAGLNSERDFVSATVEDETNESREVHYHPNAARPVPYPTTTPQSNKPKPMDLSSLPRLTFVHPRHAAIPQLTHLRIRTEPDLERERERFLATQRTRGDCSLKCPLGLRTTTCAPTQERSRATSNNTVVFTERSVSDPRSLFEDLHARQEQIKTSSNDALLTTPAISIPLTPLAEILLTTLLTFASALLALPLPTFPQPAALKTLYSDRTTPAEKVAALKSLVAGAGQVLVLLSVLAVLWHVLTLLGRVVEFVVWPFLVPFRILRWVGG